MNEEENTRKGKIQSTNKPASTHILRKWEKLSLNEVETLVAQFCDQEYLVGVGASYHGTLYQTLFHFHLHRL